MRRRRRRCGRRCTLGRPGLSSSPGIRAPSLWAWASVPPRGAGARQALRGGGVPEMLRLLLPVGLGLRCVVGSHLRRGSPGAQPMPPLHRPTRSGPPAAQVPSPSPEVLQTQTLGNACRPLLSHSPRLPSGLHLKPVVKADSRLQGHMCPKSPAQERVSPLSFL